MSGTKIGVLTMFFNEEQLAPFFLSHYRDVDEIRVLYEQDSDDRTLAIISSQENVQVRPIHIPDGINDAIKVTMINDALAEMTTDWVYVVDSDEFILPKRGEAPRAFLRRQQQYDVVNANMYQVYRHRTDADLDPSLPTIPQRRHGDPDLFSTVNSPNRAANIYYCKPIVVRPSAGIRFGAGNHNVVGPARIAPESFTGAHWQMADPALAVRRRLLRQKRISAFNKARQMGFQHLHVTEDWILEECERHLDDPLLDELC